MFRLTETERALVLVICLSLLILTIVITVCVVHPSCWLYECLQRLAKRRKLKYGKGLEEGTFIRMAGTPQYTLEIGPPSRMANAVLPDASQPGHRNHIRKREDSTYSSMSSSSQGNASVSNYVSYLSEASPDTPLADSKDQEMTFGQVTFSLCCGANEKGTIGQLIIGHMEAQYLPPRLYGGTCDPYLVIFMFRDKGRKRWSKNKNSPFFKFRTATQKKTQHAIFHENFVMDITKNDLKDNVLKIVVHDDEKYANDSELGEVTVPLKDIPFHMDGEEHVITLDFVEPKMEKGELLFGISYLPTAERLTFNVARANNLPIITADIESFAPFVRILLMHNGKLLKKKKTSARPGTASPIFNESLTFDVPPTQLDHVIFLLVASHRDTPEGAISSPDSPTTPPNNNSKKGRHIGKVVIGSSIQGLGLTHWNAMKQTPRKQVTQWHNLR